MRAFRSPVLLTAAILLAAPAGALAARASTCIIDTGKSRCVRDQMKEWERTHDTYHDREELVHTRWHKENDIKGATDEVAKAHREEHARMKAVHDEFHAEERDDRRSVFGAEEKARRAARRTADREPSDPIADRCLKEEDDLRRRTCVRAQRGQKVIDRILLRRARKGL